MVEQVDQSKPEEVQAEGEAKAEEVEEKKEGEVPDSQMADVEWKTCEDGSEVHLLFCTVMGSLESLCEKQFDLFQIIGYQNMANQPEKVPGTIMEAKIKVTEEAEGNVLHVKLWKPPGDGEQEAQVASLRKDMKEADDFAWEDEHNVPGVEIPGMEVAPQGIPISSKVNQTDAKALQDMGFSVNVSEKALFMTQNNGVQAAMQWIEGHMEDADYEEPLLIVGQSNAKGSGSTGGGKTSAFANMTKEEKLAAGKELQAKLREKRLVEDAKNKEENAKEYARAQKELAMAKKINDEREIQNAFDQQKRDKAEFLAQKKKMMEQLERDKRERFGGSMPEAAKKAEKTPQEKIENGIKTVKTLYTEVRAPGVAKLCLKTCCTFLRNVVKDQNNEKFRKINLDNNAVSTRVGKVNGGIAILKGAGFTNNPDGSNTLVLETVDMAIIEMGIKLLEPEFD